MTLQDRFERIQNYLRISVTDRCNLRCVYCMPECGLDWKPREDILTYEEILRLATLMVSMGVTKIRLTGGEPTLRRDLEELIEGLASIQGLEALYMTTNGLNLAEKASTYKHLGMTGVNVSLDTLKPHRFLAITRRAGIEKVLKGIDKAIYEGFRSVKLNVVLMAGVNDDEILDFVDFASDKPVNVRFIEWMPFQQTAWNPKGMVSYHDMKQRIEAHYSLTPIPTESSAVAKDFSIEGFQGSVSFITSMTESFCDTCSRIRLTADGHIKACLFDPAEVSLRTLIRSGASDEELMKQIRQAVWLKPQGHPPAIDIPANENRAMAQIGG